MKNIIVNLWKNESLPIKDAIYFSDDSSFFCKITSYPVPHIEKGGEFDLLKFYEENADEVTNIDCLKEIRLSNNGYCCIGEGSYGSEGFIACLDKDKNLIWVIYSENSNPIINVFEDAEGVIIAESSAEFRLKINIDNPLGLELII
ncbi:hypothetical protein GCM10023078_16130 [Gibbsiella greigii]